MLLLIPNNNRYQIEKYLSIAILYFILISINVVINNKLT